MEGEEARNIEEAISVLSVTSSGPAIDKHPEKRMKAAYEDFEKSRQAGRNILLIIFSQFLKAELKLEFKTKVVSSGTTGCRN